MTCDKCHKEIQEDEERYTSMEPRAFRHAACHATAPKWTVPPTQESMAECVRLGLISFGLDGRPVGHAPKTKVAWGHCELVELVKALWPDIPTAGVPWKAIVERAKQAAAALARSKEPSILSKVGQDPDENTD